MAQRRVRTGVRLLWAVAAAVAAGAIVAAGAAPRADDTLDRDAGRWVKTTLARMSLDEKIGQMLVPSFESTFIASDSDAFDRLVHLVRDDHVGGFHVFGGSRPTPGVLLNAGYSSVTLGDPFEAASVLNRLQAIAPIPLLNTADFEAGVGFRLAGATVFPRNMAFGAAGDEHLAFEAGRVTAVEGRAVGVHVDFAPIVDVNDNPRNPVINTRSFGEDPAAVARLGAAYVRGLQAGGMLATLKHFPGHGNTDVDSHLGLPIIREPRAELDQVELAPFRAGIAAGADAVMIAHIEMPALDPAPETPATLSRPIVTGLLRGELGFDGLVYTDSMSMDAVAKMLPPGEAAVRAVEAGNDVVLHSPDDDAALAAIKAAVEKGEIPEARIAASAERILRAKARLGLYSHEGREPRVDRRDRRGPRAPRGGRGGEPPVAHADQGRSQSGPAARRARCAHPLFVSARLPVGLGHRGAEPDVHEGAARPLAGRDGRRAVGPDIARRAGPGARHGAALRRRRRVGVRAHGVLQRPHGPRAARGAAAARPRAHDRGVGRAVRRGAVREPVRGDVSARAAGRAADLRLLRPARAVGGEGPCGGGGHRGPSARWASRPVSGWRRADEADAGPERPEHWGLRA